jgi:hypothetical protein
LVVSLPNKNRLKWNLEYPIQRKKKKPCDTASFVRENAVSIVWKAKEVFAIAVAD